VRPAAIAGFFKTLELLQPSNIHVLAELGFVRNSCGADAYVADEVITGHSGARVFIGNTDAEGRLVLSDCVSHLRQKALGLPTSSSTQPPPRLMTICTLTGHAMLSVGPYSIAVDNAVGKREGLARSLQQSGEVWGDPFEVSILRREDVSVIAPKNKSFDVVQCLPASSTGTSRGHQYPAAFIMKAGGLDKHGVTSERPIAFSHLDIAGSAVENIDYRYGATTAAPLVALTARYVLDKCNF